MFSFEITSKDDSARTGIIKTAHGVLETPAFIPVATRAAIKGLSSLQLEDIGYQAVLANTYHLYLKPGDKTVANLGGLHGFMAWDKVIFTDSGGFQVFSLDGRLSKADDDGVDFKSYIDNSKHRFTPEKSMQIQDNLGADIIFTFDECIHFDDDHERTKQAMGRTHAWTLRCLAEHQRLQSKTALFGIVQGGKYKDLREESARFISSLPFPGYGIGGIFGDPSKEIHEVVKHTMQFLPEDKPKHMLGIGSVEDIFDYVGCGADTFDCVLPTRLARLGYFFIRPESGGAIQNKFRARISNVKFKEDSSPLDENCSCLVCRKYSKAYIYHLFKVKELLFYSLMTYHNLAFFFRLLEEVRKSIKEERFLEFKQEWLDQAGRNI
ncbi:tRNA guanosine(34) transglycosylase Tgt [Candidatus Woesearchaeota archaeon CG10_big_fil_rev_8_21_14_0_10_45_16]|nr:MAG: tRNA guanosine(34) transglycosylase Tgt [Candidatus Woesearchaeota archaeon CG10_big_fil_rev_8_21_14_0_10_45_16]